MKACFGCNGPRFLKSYMTEVYKLKYNEVPNYSKLKKLFTDHLGTRNPTKTLEWISSSPTRKVLLVFMRLHSVMNYLIAQFIK